MGHTACLPSLAGFTTTLAPLLTQSYTNTAPMNSTIKEKKCSDPVAVIHLHFFALMVYFLEERKRREFSAYGTEKSEAAAGGPDYEQK